MPTARGPRCLTVAALGALVLAVAGCGGNAASVIQFVELLPAQPRIGDVVTVRFKLLDSRGLPLAGQNVDFKLQSETSGVKLAPTSTASLKGSGFAETQVIASGRVNAVVVVATAGDKSVTSGPITFAGTVPSARQFTFQCGPISGTASGGRHAIGAYDATRSLIAGVKLECTAHTGDRNGDGVPGALVSFMVEAGTVGPTETSQTDVIGNASILYKTSLPLPVEVPAGRFTWTPDNPNGTYLAPLWMHPYEWVMNPLDLLTIDPLARTYDFQEPRRPDPIRIVNTVHPENNPRDNLVTLIAVTRGEEAFVDSNNNGVWDDNESYTDLPEPFVDANDNGVCEASERYIDLNGNEHWDGPNGQWDSSTLIWVQERILWTGMPAMEDGFKSVPGVQGQRPVFAALNPTIRLRCPAAIPVGSPCYQAHDDTSTASPPAANVEVRAYLADPWFNSLARNSDGDGCTLDIAGKAPIELKSSTKTGIAYTYPAGEGLSFQIGDARDPNVPPIEQVPKRGAPISFSVPIICTYTASPKDGHVIKVAITNVIGDID